MTGERYVGLGLATARSAWFTRVARWATVGSVPLDFVKCIDADEVRAATRLGAAVLGGADRRSYRATSTATSSTSPPATASV